MRLGVHPDRFTLESLRHPGVYLEVNRRWNPSAPQDIGIAVRVEDDGKARPAGRSAGPAQDLDTSCSYIPVVRLYTRGQDAHNPCSEPPAPAWAPRSGIWWQCGCQGSARDTPE